MRRVAVLFVVAACGEPSGPPYVEVALIPTTPSRDLDILFVIDDSPGLLDRQASLGNAFPALIDELTAIDGKLPNLHIGIVTSDLGSKGYEDGAPGPSIGSGPGSCSGYGKAGQLVTSSGFQGPFLFDVEEPDGSRTTNYSGNLVDTARQALSVGSLWIRTTTRGHANCARRRE